MIKPRHGQYVSRFVKYFLPTLDQHHNLVIQGKLSGMEYIFLEHLASFAWDGKNGRNLCRRSISRIAHDFGKKPGTVRKWTKKLAELGLIRKRYLITFTDTCEQRVVSTQKKAFGICKNNRASYRLVFDVCVDGLSVGRGRNENGVAARAESHTMPSEPEHTEYRNDDGDDDYRDDDENDDDDYRDDDDLLDDDDSEE